MMESLKNTYSTFWGIFVFFFLFFVFNVFPNITRAQDLSPEKIQIYTIADGLASNSVLCMDQDKNGDLWIGTGKGASRFDGKSFINYGAANGFSDDEVWAILCDSKGYIWFGTKGDGLFRFDGRRGTRFTKIKEGLPLNDFFNGFLYEDNKKNVWGGGVYGEVFKYSNGKLNSFKFSGSGAAEDLKKNLFIADDEKSIRIIRIDGNSNKIPYRGFERTTDIAIDRLNNMYVANPSYLSKSIDGGISFENYEYDPKTTDLWNACWDMFIDNKDQIWIAKGIHVVRFNGTRFNYYNQKDGLPKESVYYIFQDKHGHFWFCSGYGLVKFDNILPKLVLPKAIPEVVKSKSISFQFNGDDGKFGSPVEELTYEYKLDSGQKWQKSKNGHVYLDKLRDDATYQPQLRVTDSFQNSTVKRISFHVKIDTSIPTVEITNREKFSKPVDQLNIEFAFTGKDVKIRPEELQYKYRLEKRGVEYSIFSNKPIWSRWSEWTSKRKAAFNGLDSGEYIFYVRSLNKKKMSQISEIPFIVEALVNKPKIEINVIKSCYFIEKNNRPVLVQIPVERKIASGRISFEINPIDLRPAMSKLKYSLLLKPKINQWTIYSDKNQYEFNDLHDGEYLLAVRAKDNKGFVSTPVEKKFTVEGFNKLPQTEFVFDKRYQMGKIVGMIVKIKWKADIDGSLHAYQFNDRQWTEFQPRNFFTLPNIRTGKHVIQVVAKNDFGIEPMPAIHEFNYERIKDVPNIKLTSTVAETVDSNTVSFTFMGDDDMENGDKTPSDSLKYSYRLIPLAPRWSSPDSNMKKTYSDLENGSYFFQVKAIDKTDNESVAPAEHFFTVKVIPFYQEKWFIMLAAGFGAVLAIMFSIVFTRRWIKIKIYEQRYNPYVVGEAVHDPAMFFGREILMQDVFQSLKNNSLCLTGERRIGKTTFLEHIDKNATKPVFSFFCNLESVEEILFFSRIMQHLVSKIKSVWPNAALDLVLSETEHHEYDDVDFEEDVDTVIQFLRSNYAPNASIIMCLDEIDATQEFPDEIHQSLRNIFQTYQGVIRMAAAGVSIRRGDWRMPTSPWYNFFEFIDISALDRKNSELLITNPVKGFYSYEKLAVDFILDKTDCKPFYIQMICKKAITRILDKKHRKVTMEDVKNIYEKMIRLELNREFETFWEDLSQDLQRSIIMAVSGKPDPISREYEKELNNNEYNHGHQVIMVRDGRLSFSSIFRDWLEINYVKKDSESP